MARAELVRRLTELEALDDDVVVGSGKPMPRASRVTAEPVHRLSVDLDDGRHIAVDLDGLIHRAAPFAHLHDAAPLLDVAIVHEGAALRVAADPKLEIGIDLILALAERQRPMRGQDFGAWMQRHQLSDNTAADVLGLARRTVQGYKAAATVPPLVAVACRAFDADLALMPALYHPRHPGRRRKSPDPAVA